MNIDFRRIAETIDIERLRDSRVDLVGCGASHHFATCLARSGIGHFRLFDGDKVVAENLCRTNFAPKDVGSFKVVALAESLRSLGAHVECHARHFADVDEPLINGSSLVIAATDSFHGQAAVNRVALKTKTPSLFVGLTEQGLGGEVVFWYPGLPCFRCLVAKRYQAWEGSPETSREFDPPSDGTTTFDVAWADAIAGHLALGLLLRGTATRFARLVEHLGFRNYLRLKIDPTYRQSGRDLVQVDLGIPADNPHFSGWCVSAISDPDEGTPPCVDCQAGQHRALPKHSFSLSPTKSQCGGIRDEMGQTRTPPRVE